MSDDGDTGEEGREEVIEDFEFDAEGWEEVPTDAEEVSKLFVALQGAVPDVLKEAFAKGVEGVSSSEERIRDALSDRNELTGEAVAYLLQHADSFKKEFFRVLSREIRDALEEMDFGGELAEVLTRLSLEARLQVRFRENEEDGNPDSVEPRASGNVRVTESDSPPANVEDDDPQGE